MVQINGNHLRHIILNGLISQLHVDSTDRLIRNVCNAIPIKCLSTKHRLKQSAHFAINGGEGCQELQKDTSLHEITSAVTIMMKTHFVRLWIIFVVSINNCKGYDDKCWRSSNSPSLSYIYAGFPTPVCIAGIQTWGYPNSSGYVSNYSLGYIPHGSSKYQLYASDRVVEGNSDSTSGAYHELPPKLVWLIFATPEQFTVSPDWRWELYGCVKRHGVDEMLLSVVMRYMHGGLQQLPPLVNALDLDKEAAQSTFLLSDDDRDTCLDPPGPCKDWHTLVRIASFPGEAPLRIVGRGIKCDSRHVLVTYPQNMMSRYRLSRRVCLLVSNGDCEAHCADNSEQVRDLTIYVRGEADARLCEVTSDSFVYVL
ncbi:hypothetical protein CAPTEDRAFT_217331 [Capitella teleta]|uniref:Uncharacterized protein n=1 Tax=Capitella teleta TaxID=283909 RepID=R7TB56_CAPTE|nr:hypothetical protein CAPTEDRAFT_217331 [Capitella teleta]|eukprot:ELT88234.1 hypothetical protein CAPTEDRAFT_217331 [Capitella teleta]